MLRLYEIRRDPELRQARKWFLTEFKATEWSEIKARYLSHQDEDRWFRMTISYWEMVGSIVNREVLHPELFFDHTGEDIVTWERCKAWIAGGRADIRPTYLMQFERMVAAHQEYRKRTNALALAAQKQGNGAGDGATAAKAKTAAAGRAPALARAGRKKG